MVVSIIFADDTVSRISNGEIGKAVLFPGLHEISRTLLHFLLVFIVLNFVFFLLITHVLTISLDLFLTLLFSVLLVLNPFQITWCE